VEEMSDLKRMRIIATSALASMAGLYILARSLEHHALFWGYVAAFAEAAVVGALADWFAIVALFRHPLGIPIPHTAIIPTNKDRIGRTLANFVVTNFLTGDAIRHRLERVDLTAKAAEWLWANAHGVSDRVVAAAPVLLSALKDEDIQRFLHGTILAKLRAIEVAPLAGKVLKAATAGERLDDVVVAAIGLVEELVRGNQELIQAQVRKRIPLPDLPGISRVKDALGDAIAKRVSEAMLENLREARGRPNHPFRREFRAKAAHLAEELQHSEAYRQQGEEIKEEVLRHPAIKGYLAELVRDLQQDFEHDLASGDSRIRTRVEQGVVQVAHLLIEDHALRAKLNGWLRSGLVDLVEKHGPDVSQFIQERVGRWDAAQLTTKLEESMGRDLQYIRLNGTLVGGLIGLLIFTLSQWIW
jgi:uncharacterized membrane-anchored protein YjiN (DUF445 family)